jgi:heme/copper-type cytochrome/quinol oxidase subunit 1
MLGIGAGTMPVMLRVDRRLDAHFFTLVAGGSPLLWQYHITLFGHPEVYFMGLPAFGIIAKVIPLFSRTPIYVYEFVAGSTVAIAFFSFAVSAHHIFTADLDRQHADRGANKGENLQRDRTMWGCFTSPLPCCSPSCW